MLKCFPPRLAGRRMNRTTSSGWRRGIGLLFSIKTPSLVNNRTIINTSISNPFLLMDPGFKTRDIRSQKVSLFQMPFISGTKVYLGVIIYRFKYVVNWSVPTLSHRSVPLSWHIRAPWSANLRGL